MSIRIALVQTSACGRAEEHLEEMLRFAGQAAREGCAAVCFPEASLTGYAPEQAAQRAIGADSPLLARLAREARTLGVDLLPGYMERRGGDCCITQSILRADGARFDYRKTHLGEKERRFFAAGDRLDVFPLTCGLTAGFQLCVETHFPEITQTLSLRGAQIVFAPHAVPGTPQRRRELWQRVIPARAYDNRVVFACCNQWDDGRFGGGCFAAGPDGELLADCFEPRPMLTVLEADPEQLARLRSGADLRSRYFPALRRPELYE